MKRTIFEGTVNGQKFDNVDAYNARLNELLAIGANIEASSNTKIEDVDNIPSVAASDINAINRSGYVSTVTNRNQPEMTCTSCTIDSCMPWDEDDTTCESDDPFEDDDLSFYPYCESDDPHYLDLLVTYDEDVNAEAIKEMRNTFDKCFKYITDALDDKDVNVNTKKEYLDDIRNIIKELKKDNKYNLEALTEVKNKKIDSSKEYEVECRALEEKYNERMKQYDTEEYVLRAAKPVIDEFIQFYSAIEAETIESIAEAESCKHCEMEKTKCQCDCNIDASDVKTEVKESVPQTEWDFNRLMDLIFGPGIIRTKLK